jgi:hypothetical protein
MAGRRRTRGQLTERRRGRIIAFVAMRASVLQGLVLVAITAGCRSRPLDGDGQGSLTRDAAIESAGPLLVGQSCASSGECRSGFCVDGVCCASACVGPCQSCNDVDTIGTCVPVTASGAPRIEGGCQPQSPSTCGLDGTCDGVGGCRLWPMFTVCVPGRCDGDAVVDLKVCDGRGNCRTGPTEICAPYGCDPVRASCRGTCLTDAECSGTYCELDGRCHMNIGPGCQSNNQCATGFCSQGTCCDRACDGACQACNLRGREGACSPVPDCPAADAGTD